jgi:phosphatidylserine/phosphatidylglycerophosphate/cardiolipin synthase-like enzyme
VKRFLLVAAACLALSPALAGETRPRLELHYGPAENLEKIDVAAIDQAGVTLDVAAYVLTDVAVIEAMTDAAERGVKVRLYREPSQDHSGGAVGAALAALIAAPGVEQRFNKREVWMHLKAYLVDGATLRFGAANLSASGLKQQDNDLLLTDDPGLVKAFQTEFETLWLRQ